MTLSPPRLKPQTPIKLSHLQPTNDFRKTFINKKTYNWNDRKIICV